MTGKRTAIVTGAARGIGESCAHSLAEAGWRVALFDADEAVRDVADRLNQSYPDAAEARIVDISDEGAVEDAINGVAAAGPIGALVNNAGIIHRGTFREVQTEDWDRVMSVNLGGTFYCCKAVVPYMADSGGGKIVNVTSIAGKMGDITASPAYGTSKGAINTLTKSMARQLAEHQITVNAVAPHAIETPMSSQWSEEKRQAVISAIPLKRLGKPEEVAAAVMFLLSEGANFITGEIIDVNGGFLMD